MRQLFQRNKVIEPKAYKLPVFVKVLDRFQSIFTNNGVNYPELRLIIKTKLLMDTRIDSNRGDGFNNKQKDGRNKYLQSIWLNLFMGLFMTVLLFMPVPAFSRYGLIFLAGFFMLLMSLLQSFSGLLLNPKDREIMGTRGVDDRTLNISRFTYISYYVLLTFFSLLGPAIIASIINDGPLTGLVFLVMALLIGLTTLFMAMLLYLVILKTFSGERLKNMLNSLQIFMVILTVAIFYIPQFMNYDKLDFLPNTFQWFYTFTFPVWFAAPVTLMTFNGATVNLIVLTVLSFVLTWVMFILYRNNSGKFELYLAKLSSNEGSVNKNSWWFKLATKLAAKSPKERTYFKLAWRIMQNEREFKLKTYPMFGMGFLIIAIMVVSSTRSIMESMKISLFSAAGFDFMQDYGIFSFLSFSTIFGAQMIGIMLDQSTQANGFTILNAIPNSDTNLYRRATLKAVIMRFILPISLMSDVVTIFLVKPKYYLMLLAGPALSILLFLCVASIFMRKVPFNELPTPSKGSVNSAKGAIATVLMIWLAMALAAGAYFWVWGGVIIVIASLLVSYLLLYHVKTKQEHFYVQ